MYARTGNTILSLLLLTVLAMPAAAGESVAAVAADPIVTRKVEGKFAEVLHDVRIAIINNGINIAHTLPASSMLRRTGRDFGYRQDVYSDAETIEFCSARVSHLLARAHPDNIVLCPFTISVYELAVEPGYVRLSYRIPTGRPGSEEAVAEVITLIENILEDATW